VVTYVYSQLQYNKKNNRYKGAEMKKAIIATLLGILLIGASGVAVVNAVASDNAGTNYGFGPMNRWAAKYTNSSSSDGNFSYCPYFNSNGTSELKVKTADEALEIAKKEINTKVSIEDISQMRRWWIVAYQNEDGAYRQARIDAFSGQVFTNFPVCTGTQTGSRRGMDQGYCRAYAN
jgi:hypothetical protein